jgi:hypothetical protein
MNMFGKINKLVLALSLVFLGNVNIANAANNADSHPNYNNPYMMDDIVFTAGTNVQRTIRVAKHPSAQSDCVCKWQNSPLKIFKGTNIPEKQSLDGTGFDGTYYNDTNPNPLYYSALVDIHFEGQNCGGMDGPGGANDYTGVITCNPNSTAVINDIGHAAVPFTPCVLTCNVTNGSTISTTQDFSGTSKYESCVLSGGSWNENHNVCSCGSGKAPDGTTGACKTVCSPSYSYKISGTSCMKHDNNNCGGSDTSVSCSSCSGYSGNKGQCCPSGKTWNGSACVSNCSPSYSYKISGTSCMKHDDNNCGGSDTSVSCSSCSGYSGNKGQCCPSGKTWNGSACVAPSVCTAPKTWDGTTMVSGGKYCTTPETCGCGVHNSTQLYRKAPSNTGYGNVGKNTICCYQSQINSDDHCCAGGQHWSGSKCVANCTDSGKGGFGQEDKCNGSCNSGLTENNNGGTCGCNTGYRGTGSGGSCTKCSAGTFRSGWTSTATSCSQCPVNTWSSAGVASCTACTGGRIAPAGSTSADACGCPADKPFWTGSTCKACAAGEVFSSGSCWKVSDKDLTCFEKGDGTCKFADSILKSGSLGVLYKVIK